MRRSDNFIEVLKAIDEAKPMFKSLKKTSRNPHFKSEYADLDEVLESIKDGLREKNVTVNQFPNYKDGHFVLTTIVTHPPTKAFLESDYSLLLEKSTSQGQGSAITYARRYSLSAIFGLYEFDDDGNAASQIRKPTIQSKKNTNKELLKKIMRQMQIEYEDILDQDLVIIGNHLMTLNIDDVDIPMMVRQEFDEKFKKKGVQNAE